MELAHSKPESTVQKTTWDYVASMEIWPQGTPFYRVRGFSVAIDRSGMSLASNSATYAKVGIQVLTNPALAWAICYGYRPKLLIYHLPDWLWAEPLSSRRARQQMPYFRS